MTNNNVKLIDLPFFELCNQAPVASTAVSALATVEDGNNRYIYYLTGTLFYRYDTFADTWQQLTTPVSTPLSGITLRYTGIRGYHGRILGATSSTVTIPGLRGNQFDGQQIKILSGTGQGQTRTLTYVNETIHETGVVTTLSFSSMTDNLKKWIPNQWAGYTIGITFGTGATQYKKILYNDTNTVYIADANLMPHDPWNNQTFVANFPYAVPVTTGGLQAHFVIMSSTYTLNSNWTVVPDYTSYFTLLSGGLYALSSVGGAPYFMLQYYDIIHDSWTQKTVSSQILSGTLGIDYSIERTGKLGNVYLSNTSINGSNTSGTIRTITDSGLSLTNDRYANFRVFITGGPGNGQTRRIVGHTSDTFTVNKNWDIIPDNTTTYEIWPDTDKLYFVGNQASSMYAYSPENDFWMQGQSFDDGVLSTTGILATIPGYPAFAVTSGIRIALGVITISSIPVSPGTNYVIGEIITFPSGTGTGAQAVVTSINLGGIVATLQLLNSGTVTGYVTGTSGTQTATSGVGVGCTINITSVGPTAQITLASASILRTNNIVTFSGCNEAAWNAPHTILGINSITTTTTLFSVASTALLTMATAAAQTTATIVDKTKNWIVNEHAGRLVHLMTNSIIPTATVRWIFSNSANTLNIASMGSAAINNYKYVIYDSKVFGVDDQRKETGMSGYGYATSGNNTTLVDNTKNWIPNQWANYFFKIETGSGYGSGRIAIANNTSNTLIFSAQTFIATSNTKYEIADTWGLNNAATLNTVTETGSKNWAVNQWTGKRVRVTSGAQVAIEAGITSSAATTLAASIGTPDSNTSYAILSIPHRTNGIELSHIWGCTDQTKRGKYMYCARGNGSNTLDIYDITTGRWTFGTFFSPQTEGFTFGSSYCYDGKDLIYLSRSVNGGPIRVFSLDVNKNQINGAMTTTIVQNNPTVGNMMEIVNDATGTLRYIYCLQNSGTLLVRALIF